MAIDFARRQRDPTRHIIGISLVILIHVVVIYGLVTGLARKAVEVIKKPLNATIVEEIKAIEVAKIPPPLQPYVPPPEVPVPAMPSEPVIAAITPTPPPAPPVIAPPAPPPPPAPPKAAIVKNIVPVSKPDLDYPSEAQRKGIEGTVVAHLSIDEKGNVTDVKIVQVKPPNVARYFERATRDALMQWKFSATGEKFIGEIEVSYKLQ
jgi:protein TonB